MIRMGACYLTLILLCGSAWADSPQVTWATSNPAVKVFTKGPLPRTWTWTCDDPGDHFPLELRCQVYDITKGPMDRGSGAGALYLTSGPPGAIWKARTAKDEIRVLASFVPVY